MPASQPASSAEVTDFGSCRFARRSASATVSNQAFLAMPTAASTRPTRRRPRPARSRSPWRATLSKRPGGRPPVPQEGIDIPLPPLTRAGPRPPDGMAFAAHAEPLHQPPGRLVAGEAAGDDPAQDEVLEAQPEQLADRLLRVPA